MIQKEKFIEKFHGNERVIFLSDGVFAIVLTLLVLELKIPHLDEHASALQMWQALQGIKSKLLSFVLSFIFIATLWFSHNQLFKLFYKIDNVMLWLNNLFLLTICFIPFPTALIGEYPDNPVGIMLFGILWIIIPLLVYALGSRAINKKCIAKHVDMKRYLELRKTTLYFVPISFIPLSVAWFMPKTTLLIYMVMNLVGIIMGFNVKLNEDTEADEI